MFNLNSREVTKGVHRVMGLLNGKVISVYLLEGRFLVLFDSGINLSPNDLILPYLRKIGYKISDVNIVIISHCDADHFGGNSILRKLNPNLLIISHHNDVIFCENVNKIAKERYDGSSQYGVSYGNKILNTLIEWMGKDEKIDITFKGGELIKLGDGFNWEIIHTPGHTDGHISLYNKENEILIAGDSIMGDGIVNIHNELIMPPIYTDIKKYKKTIENLKKLKINLLLTSHYEIIVGKNVEKFLEKSDKFISNFEKVLEKTLDFLGNKILLCDVIDIVGKEMGSYIILQDFSYPIKAHMDLKVKKKEFSLGMIGKYKGWIRK